jgi:hypothetical protein
MEQECSASALFMDADWKYVYKKAEVERKKNLK